MTNKKFLKPLALLMVSLGSGCAVGPDYHAPALSVPLQFTSAESARYTPQRNDELGQFWTVFADATLSSLVSDALLANHDLRMAIARVDEARALRGAAKLDLAPTLSAQAGYSDQRLAQAQAFIAPRDRENYAVGIDAFWELDFVGRLRRQLQASTAELQAVEAGLLDAQVIVTAELTRSYFELRGNQQRLAVATRNVNNQFETLQLTMARLEAGRGTELDAARATTQLETTRASMAPLQAAVARTIHRISVLTGREPTALLLQLALPAALPSVPELVAVGDPAQLLRRRPDIRLSERRLAAATARIGVAVADLFPRVNIVGSVGYAAANSDDLGAAGAGTHLLAPTISWGALDLGHVQARIGAAEARNDGALASYEQTVLRALQETEDALVTHARSRERLLHLTEAATASQTASQLARLRFDNGAADFLQVLDAERSQLLAEDSLAQSRTDTAMSLVAVYKALGGGWAQYEGDSK
jgi:outer membrane protein, multidrug efflux system